MSALAAAHLMRFRLLNQALDASPSNPIRGQTENTLENIPLRVPVIGISSTGLQEVESAGNSSYNGLEVSLTKQFSRGLQFLASYTFSKSLDTDGANINGTGAGNAFTRGDQDSPTPKMGTFQLRPSEPVCIQYGVCPAGRVFKRLERVAFWGAGRCRPWQPFSPATL